MATAVTTTRRTTKTKTKTSANTDVLENQHIKLRKTLPPEAIIPVINGFQGKLIAQNRRTHEEFIWEEFGDVQDLTFADVKSIYSTDKAFFSNNWFLFEDTLVLEVLNAENITPMHSQLKTLIHCLTKLPTRLKQLFQN